VIRHGGEEIKTRPPALALLSTRDSRFPIVQEHTISGCSWRLLEARQVTPLEPTPRRPRPHNRRERTQEPEHVHQEQHRREKRRCNWRVARAHPSPPERTHPSAITPCGDHRPSRLPPRARPPHRPDSNTHKASRPMRLQHPLGRCATLPGGPSHRLLRASAAEITHDNCSAAGTLARLCSRHLACAPDLASRQQQRQQAALHACEASPSRSSRRRQIAGFRIARAADSAADNPDSFFV